MEHGRCLIMRLNEPTISFENEDHSSRNLGTLRAEEGTLCPSTGWGAHSATARQRRVSSPAKEREVKARRPDFSGASGLSPQPGMSLTRASTPPTELAASCGDYRPRHPGIFPRARRGPRRIPMTMVMPAACESVSRAHYRDRACRAWRYVDYR